MSGSWAVSHPHARPMPAAHSNNGHRSLVGERQDYIDTPSLITYVGDGRGDQCLYLLAGLRCPLRRSHPGECEITVRSETGLDFTVTWAPAGHEDDAKRVARVHAENASLWAMVTCRICGNGPETARDRGYFLTSGAHAACLADEAPDLSINRDVEEHFA